jgi:hypothetical protein
MGTLLRAGGDIAHDAPRRRTEPLKVRRHGNGELAGPGPAAAPAARRPSKGLAAEHPDAAPRRGHDVLRAGAHGVIQLALGVFELVYCVWMPMAGRAGLGARRACVTLVPPLPCEIRAPETSGVFRAARPLLPGTHVEAGELLGRIESPGLDHDIARASLELRVLESRRLRLDAGAAYGEQPAQEAQEARDLAGRVEVVAQSLARLHAVRSQLAVYAPCPGQVHNEVRADAALAPRQLIVSLYPDGGELLAEVTGPVDVITRLQSADVVAAQFTTAGGNVELVARPVAGSVRHFRKHIEGGHEETWATVQCQPESVPPALQTPGLIGELR